MLSIHAVAGEDDLAMGDCNRFPVASAIAAIR